MEKMKKQVMNAVNILVLIPSSFRSDDRRVANKISVLVHKLGGMCCHTSAESMKFEEPEERHQLRISKALEEGGRVFAFNASTELCNMGVVQMGNMHINGDKRLEAAIAATT
jgi:hypothetical protein